MNKIITTAGFAALGVASLHAADVGSTTINKPWNISATLRGFYDDNYTTSPKQFARDSFGFEVSPSAGLNIVRDQTTLGLSYVYGMRYYDDRISSKADHSHQANAKLSHAFSPRYKADLSDSFVIAQEPAVLDPTAVVTVPLRTNGDNIRNYVTTSFSAGLTENLTAVLGYSNTYYDYEQEGFSFGQASRSALLDRFEHLISLNLRYQILRTTVGVAGYQFGIVDYTSPEAIGFVGGNPVRADIRDNTSHYFYLGVDQMIHANLNASARVGVQHTEYSNADRLPGLQTSSTGPYADGNITWTYLRGSYAQIGLRHARNQTDVGFFNGGVNPTLDAESTTVYGSLNHQITGKLVGSLLGQYQHSTFEGGLADGTVDQYYMAGANLTYEINKFLSAEAGYNYDHLTSELAFRGYNRNRVYIGIRASY